MPSITYCIQQQVWTIVIIPFFEESSCIIFEESSCIILKTSKQDIQSFQTEKKIPPVKTLVNPELLKTINPKPEITFWENLKFTSSLLNPTMDSQINPLILKFSFSAILIATAFISIGSICVFPTNGHTATFIPVLATINQPKTNPKKNNSSETANRLTATAADATTADEAAKEAAWTIVSFSMNRRATVVGVGNQTNNIARASTSEATYEVGSQKKNISYQENPSIPKKRGSIATLDAKASPAALERQSCLTEATSETLSVSPGTDKKDSTQKNPKNPKKSNLELEYKPETKPKTKFELLKNKYDPVLMQRAKARADSGTRVEYDPVTIDNEEAFLKDSKNKAGFKTKIEESFNIVFFKKINKQISSEELQELINRDRIPRVRMYRPIFLHENAIKINKNPTYRFVGCQGPSRGWEHGATLVWSLRYDLFEEKNLIVFMPLSSYVCLMKQKFPTFPTFQKSTDEIVNNFKANQDPAIIAPPVEGTDITFFKESSSILLRYTFFENLFFSNTDRNLNPFFTETDRKLNPYFTEENANLNPFFTSDDKKKCDVLITSITGISKYIEQHLKQHLKK